MTFLESYESTRKLVEGSLKEVFTGFEQLEEKKLYEAMNYSLLAGGKRLRPVLLLETARVFREEVEEFLPFAQALELIHTYSMIHDDLPAMDDDDLRRGCPTNHKVYGEATAILAGDGLLNKAYELLFQELLKNPAEVRVRSAALIASLSGVKGMIGGQMIDMEAQGKYISYEVLQKLDAKKTGALIKAAVLSGGLLGGASEEELKALEIYVENIGLAFQIKDDLLDVLGDSKVLGKNVGRDFAVGKSTYPSIYGIEKSKQLAREAITKGVCALESLQGRKTRFLKEMAHYIIDRNQ